MTRAQMSVANFWQRVEGRLARELAQRTVKRPFKVASDVPLISFTFDDFPRSALHVGGEILNRHGLAGTYYASMGLMGQKAPTGDIFIKEDIAALLKGGHELGCHTFDHLHSWDTPPESFEASIVRNAAALREIYPEGSFESMSYPISPPRPGTKRRTARYFLSCRGGGQTFNAGETDLNHLAAYFLEKTRDDITCVESVIEENRRQRCWLILATHDVEQNPTPYGCTPEHFSRVVQIAIASGARILPVSGVLTYLGIKRSN